MKAGLSQKMGVQARRRLAAGVLLAGLLVLELTACSGAAPDIDQVSWQIALQVSPQNERREVLSLFVLAFDKDGYNDLEEAYLVQLEDATSWWIPNQNWQMREGVGEYRWLMHTALQPVEGTHFPRGAYRVYLYDRAGEKDMLDFQLQHPATRLTETQVPLPRQVGRGLLISEVVGSNPMIRGYNYGGALIFEQPLTPGSYDFPTLQMSNAELSHLVLHYRLGQLLVQVGPYYSY